MTLTKQNVQIKPNLTRIVVVTISLTLTTVIVVLTTHIVVVTIDIITPPILACWSLYKTKRFVQATKSFSP